MPDVSWCEKGGARGYVATRPMAWDLLWKGSPHTLRVPTGREFEISSPTIRWRGRALRWFQPCHWIVHPDDERFLKPSLFHDVALEHGARYLEADMLWLTIALSNGAPRWRACLAYAGMVVLHWGKENQPSRN